MREEVLVRYDQGVTPLRTSLAVAGPNEVAKVGPSCEHLRKFSDVEEKEDVESSKVGVDKELP